MVSTQPGVPASTWPPPVKQRLVPSHSAQASPQPEENCFLGWGFLSAHHWNIPATEFKTGIVAGGCRMSSGFFLLLFLCCLTHFSRSNALYSYRTAASLRPGALRRIRQLHFCQGLPQKTPTQLAMWNSFYLPRKDEGLSRPCRDLRLWFGQAELLPAQRLHHEAIPRGIEYLSLPVLDGELHRDPQPLPVSRGLGNVIADFFGGLRRTETLGTQK